MLTKHSAYKSRTQVSPHTPQCSNERHYRCIFETEKVQLFDTGFNVIEPAVCRGVAEVAFFFPRGKLRSTMSFQYSPVIGSSESWLLKHSRLAFLCCQGLNSSSEFAYSQFERKEDLANSLNKDGEQQSLRVFFLDQTPAPSPRSEGLLVLSTTLLTVC